MTSILATILLLSSIVYLAIGIFITCIADALGDDTGDAFTVLLWPVYLIKLLGGV